MRISAPLFRPDPGWLYVAAGLAICAMGILIPARQDLHRLEDQLEAMEELEARGAVQLRAYSDFLDAVERGDRDLIRRVAGLQLNLMPSEDVPILLDAARSTGITEWIDATVDAGPSWAAEAERPSSRLTRLATGTARLWFLAGGVFCVFIGLILSPELTPPAPGPAHQNVGGQSRRSRRVPARGPGPGRGDP